MPRIPGGGVPNGKTSNGGGRVPVTGSTTTPITIPTTSNGRSPGVSFPNAPAHNIPDETKKSMDVMLSEIAEGQLQYSLQRIRDYVTQSYLSELTPTGITGLGRAKDCVLQPFKPSSSIAIYQLCSLYYDENESIYEKVTSIYTALNMINASVAVIIRGTTDGCNVYMAVTTSLGANEVLSKSMEGVFPGSVMKRANGSTVAGIIGGDCKFIQSVSFTPSRRQSEATHETVLSAQGLEKIVEALREKDYTIVLLATGMCGADMRNRSLGLEMLSTMISSFEKQSKTITESKNASMSLSEAKTFSDSVSESLSKSYGVNHGDSRTRGSGSSHSSTTSFFGIGFNSGHNNSNAITVADGTTSGSAEAWGKVHATGVTEGFVNSTGTSRSIATNYTRQNKTVERVQNLIDTQLKRLDVGLSRGMWECACYVCAKDIATVTNACGIVASTLSGDTSNPLPVFFNSWSVPMRPREPNAVEQIIQYLTDLQHPVFALGTEDERIITVPAVMVNGMEIGSFLPLPRKSLPSVSVRTMAEFARNISFMDENRQNKTPDFTFGNIVHMHHHERIPLPFFTDIFSSHVFVTGASGSGKSNTCYALLDNLHKKNIPFLVIEPVKGDYKKKMASFPDTQVFTTINDSYRTLRINPFSFLQNSIKISTHIDHLRDTICACWPLYGPMPGMLKQAFELAYRKRGWDLKLSAQVFETERKFPNFADLAEATEEVIRSAGYSQRNESDYRGALLVRINSLMSGIERDVFSDDDFVSDRELFDQNAIVDLSHIGSPESLSLIMGLLVIKLREYRLSKAKEVDQPTCHVTVLEEAHNLLQRCSTNVSQESGDSQGKAVAEIVKCIAEMRTYGESFMIVDQSPSTVDLAAMRNTAIKIVMRLQDGQDIQAISDAMALTEEQAREISRLSRGLAVVNQSEWIEPVMAHMGGAWKSSYGKKYISPCSNNALLHIRSIVAAFVFFCFQHNQINNTMTATLQEILDDLSQVNTNFQGIQLGYKKDLILMTERLVEQYTQLSHPTQNGVVRPRDYRPRQIQLVARFLSSLLLMDDIVTMMPKLTRKKVKKAPDNISGESITPSLTIASLTKWKNKFLDKLYRFYVLPYEYDELNGECHPLNVFRGQAMELQMFMMWYVAVQHEQKEQFTSSELISGLKIKIPS